MGGCGKGGGGVGGGKGGILSGSLCVFRTVSKGFIPFSSILRVWKVSVGESLGASWRVSWMCTLTVDTSYVNSNMINHHQKGQAQPNHMAAGNPNTWLL